jgi:hypothetical protein
MQSIKKLEQSHWTSIYEHAADFMGRLTEQIVDHELEGDGEGEAVRPRTQIQINW